MGIFTHLNGLIDFQMALKEVGQKKKWDNESHKSRPYIVSVNW